MSRFFSHQSKQTAAAPAQHLDADGWPGQWTVADMKAHAQELGIAGSSKMKRAELIEAIEKAEG